MWQVFCSFQQIGLRCRWTDFHKERIEACHMLVLSLLGAISLDISGCESPVLLLYQEDSPELPLPHTGPLTPCPTTDTHCAGSECEDRDRLEWCGLKSRRRWNNQKLKEMRKVSPPEPSKGAWPCWHLDFRLLASRTGREYVPVVLSHFVELCPQNTLVTSTSAWWECPGHHGKATASQGVSMGSP